MVYFTCNACGQSLKKNQVENHYTNQCRRCEVLSCMDCGKNFEGDAYQKHVKCISEEEKYSGQNYKPKANSNKGEKKQLEWMEIIKRVMSDVKNDSKMQELLSMLITFDNIPRKKQKFQKFVECSVNFKNRNLITKAWDLIESASKVNIEGDQNGSGHKSEVTTIKPEEKLNQEIKDKKKKRKHNRDDTEDDTKQNGNDNEVDIKQDRNETKSKRKKLKNGIPDQNEDELKQDRNETKLKRKKHKNEISDQNEDDTKQNGNETKSKKKKCTDEIPTATDQETPLNDDSQQIPKKFKWRKAATSILRDVPENEMKIKKLKKKILAQYKTWNGDHMDCNNEEKLLEKIGKKLIHKKFQFDTENQKIKLMLQE